MTKTSITLGPHWRNFVDAQIESGRYGGTSEVIRAGLRVLEDQQKQREALSEHLAIGGAQADAGDFVDLPSARDLVTSALARQKA